MHNLRIYVQVKSKECNPSKHSVRKAPREPSCELLWICSEATLWRLITGVSFSCLFVYPQFCQTLTNTPKSFSASPGWCPMSTLSLLPIALSTHWSREQAVGSAHCPLQTVRGSLWQTSNCHLVSCVCCLISLFWIRLICQHMLKIKCSNDAKWDFQSMIPGAFFFLSAYM